MTKRPEAIGAIGARFSPDGKLMYLTAASGLFVYDITSPRNPVLRSFLALPHFENEDVDAGNGVVIITNDPGFTEVGVIYVIDVRDPTAPRVRATLPTQIPFVGTGPGRVDATTNGHIANCIQDCRYLWTTGSSEGIAVYDLRDLDHPRFVHRFEMPLPKSRAGRPPDGRGFTHDVYVDRSGIAWVTGEDGTFGYTTDNPVDPKLVFRSDENVTNTGTLSPDHDLAAPISFLHHNMTRTSIQLAKPSPRSQKKAKRGCRVFRKRSQCRRGLARANRRCKTMRRASRRAECRRAARRRYGASSPRARAATTRGGLGDVLAITEEDYVRPGCNGHGSIQTWQITNERNSDGTIKLKLLDMWTTELNELVRGKGRSPATVHCSAHWFDEDRGLLAQAWYDQGVRFMDISDPHDIRQVGYYVTAGTFWAAYFAPTDPARETVYAIDTFGGIDVVHISRGAGQRTVTAPTTLPRRTPRGVGFDASPRFGFACPLLTNRSRAGSAAGG